MQENTQVSYSDLMDALNGANEIIEDLLNRLSIAEQELKTLKEQYAKNNSRYEFMQLVLAEYREGEIEADDFIKKITAYDDKGWEIHKE